MQAKVKGISGEGAAVITIKGGYRLKPKTQEWETMEYATKNRWPEMELQHKAKARYEIKIAKMNTAAQRTIIKTDATKSTKEIFYMPRAARIEEMCTRQNGAIRTVVASFRTTEQAQSTLSKHKRQKKLTAGDQQEIA
jgi:hypothetical protein